MGRPKRLQILKAIIAGIQPAVIIETGTYLGTTTELMAETGLLSTRSKRILANFGFCSRSLLLDDARLSPVAQLDIRVKLHLLVTPTQRLKRARP
jgi:hypothetical protein